MFGLPRIIAKRQTQDRRWPTTHRVGYSGRTLAGVTITPDTAVTVPAVWACLRYLSQSIAVLPWHVMKTTPRGGELSPSHPVDWLLCKRPNPEWSSFQFRETLIHWALRWGNGYAEIERNDATGLPIALWPIHPDRVQPMRDIDTGALFYRVNNGDKPMTDLDPMAVLHIRGFGEDVVGVNVMAYAAESIGWARAVQLFGSGFFGQGMNPTGVVEVKGSLKPAAWEEMKARFKSLYRGVGGERNMFLDQGATYKSVTIEPEKAQFIATNQHLVEEVCRWFGVPPHKIAHLLRSTFSNIEQQSIEVVGDSLIPWAKRLEEEADYKLFGQNRQGLYTKMNFTAMLRGDSAARAQYYKDLWGIGAMTVNDILRAEDENTIPASQGGDMRFVNQQYLLLEKAMKIAAQPAAPVPSPPTPEQAQLANWLVAVINQMDMEDA